MIQANEQAIRQVVQEVLAQLGRRGGTMSHAGNGQANDPVGPSEPIDDANRTHAPTPLGPNDWASGTGQRQQRYQGGVQMRMDWNPSAVTIFGGVIMELYLTRWLSFRVDLRDVMLVQEVVAETRLTNNITIMGGFGLWVPFGF